MRKHIFVVLALVFLVSFLFAQTEGEIARESARVSTFPYFEDFEDEFPPSGWQLYNFGAFVNNWQATDAVNHTPGGEFSASYPGEGDPPWQGGYLRMPVMEIPSEGCWMLSFWSYYTNAHLSGNGTNSVLISAASPDPNDNNYELVWSPVEISSGEWTYNTVDLTPWKGEEIWIAFRYYRIGLAHDWYLDDVMVTEGQLDFEGPQIWHRPLINTLRDDSPYPVEAYAYDPNGVWYLGVFYKVDGGNWIWSFMTQEYEDGVWQGEIPAQALGSQIEYVLVAFDILENSTYTQAWSFTVDDPNWLYYDSLSEVDWGGWEWYDWALGVIYTNPLYGTGTPLHINRVTGDFLYGDTVNLEIYGFDDLYLTNMQPLMDPLECVFNPQQWQEVNLTDVTVNTEYFMVVYSDIDAGNSFAFEQEHETDSQGTNRLRTDSGVYIDIREFGLFGYWMLRVEVQSGVGLAAPVLTISMGNDGPKLNWSAVPGADSYNIYSTNTPYLPSWDLLHNTSGLSHTVSSTNPCDFFRVTAVKADANKQPATPLPNYRTKPGLPEPPLPPDRLDPEQRK